MVASDFGAGPVTFGLTQRPATLLIQAGWPEAHLRDVSAALRERSCRVVRTTAEAVYARDERGIGWGVYRSTDPAELRRQLAMIGTVDEDGALRGALAETVSIWTDGSGNRADKPAGIGVVVDWPGRERIEVSEHIGLGTNNHAELSAIRRGLEIVSCLDTPVAVFTDSAYSQTVLTRECRLAANVELVRAIWFDLRARRSWRIEHVEGHKGIELNERADKLAGAGRKKGMTT